MSYYLDYTPSPGTTVVVKVPGVLDNTSVTPNTLTQTYFNITGSGTSTNINYGQKISVSFDTKYGTDVGTSHTNAGSGVTYVYEEITIPAVIIQIWKGDPNSGGILVLQEYVPGFPPLTGPTGAPVSGGYGGGSLTLTSKTISNASGTDFRDLTGRWKAGAPGLEPSTKYFVVFPQWGGSGTTPDYYSSSYPDNTRSFTTLPVYTAPPIVNPRISNGQANITPVVIATTTTTAVLTCNFYYPASTLPNYYPAEVGFYYRNPLVTNAWTLVGTIPIAPTFVLTVNSKVNQTITLNPSPSGLNSGTEYEYISYVKDRSGSIFWSSLAIYPTNSYTNAQTNAQITKFKTLPLTINAWVDPPIGGTWYQLYNDWELSTTPTIHNNVVPYFTVRRYGSGHTNYTDAFSLFRYLNKEFKKGKTYQFRTIVESFYEFKNDPWTVISKSNFIMKTPWGEEYNYSVDTPYFPVTSAPSSIKVINLYLYSNINSFAKNNIVTKPIDKIISKDNPQNPISYTANPYFNSRPPTSSLLDVNISDFDWVIHGFAPFNILDYTSGPLNVNGDEIIPAFVFGDPVGGKGWHFIENKGQFIWFDKYNHIDPLENTRNLPIGGDINDYHTGKTPDHKYLTNNFISKYISYQTFNISFDYKNNSPFSVSMYLGGVLPNFDTNQYNLDQLISDGYVKKVLSLYQSTNGITQSCEFVGVEGNQYLFFVADPVYQHTDITNNLIISTSYNSSINNLPLTSTTYSIISLSNFKIDGGYNDQNNENFDVNTFGSVPYSTIIPVSNAKYSMKLGSGDNVTPGAVNDVVEINSSAGNGRFNSGIWENGVWNNGWREDLTRREFYKIDQFYSYEKDKKWRVRISGPVSSLAIFIIGDKISISNIIAIDINEERKLLKNYYTIVDIGSNYIEVEFENDFPLRRIEMDSDEHRIYVSKNVWLSGVFLNGYFKGIWNSGLFSGYPLITKMDESHWIDGIFNGGHFTANKYGTTFSSVFPINVNGVTRLGLSFSTPHKLTFDDIISINPYTYYVGSSIINNSLGTTTVSDVIDENRLATGINWKSEYLPILNGGEIYSIVSSGLIQNFDFYSNNVSTVTSLQSLNSERVFSYNSWIDVNYSNQSAVNIGKPQSFLDKTSNRSYSENNLYGYPTNDILSSNSVFRDSFSTSLRKYKLGKKWKIFNDYVGDSSSFEEYFDSSDTTNGLEGFNTQGWQFDINGNNIIEIPINTVSLISSYDDQMQFIYQKLVMQITNNNKIILDNIKVGDNLSTNAWKTKNPFDHDNNGNIAYKNMALTIPSNQVTDTTWNHGEITRVKIDLVVSSVTVGVPGASYLPSASEYIEITFNEVEGSTRNGVSQPPSTTPTITQTKLDDAKNLFSNVWQYLTYGYDPAYADTISPTTSLFNLGYTDTFFGTRTMPSWLVITGSGKNKDLSNYVYNWSFDLNVHNGLTFSRTPEPLDNTSVTIGKELKINSFGSGGVLNLTPAYDVANRSNGTDNNTIEKYRYSIIEFDLLKYNSATYSYYDQKLGNIPSIYFNNLNFVTRNIINAAGTQSVFKQATYLPINKNINHLLTRSKKKQEFFFNKRNLLFNFRGTGLSGLNDAEYYLDNIKFYQVNMIPFFQYFISPIGVQGNINKSVQIPNNGISPIIDYTEDNIIDSNNDNNDIITFFSNSLIASNIEIPAGINWQRDYSIYRTQISGNDILGSDDPYFEF